ncbi:MAG: histidine kinase dimerization/phospho-acceptor domain-containing protein [Acidobacteriota bacterium]
MHELLESALLHAPPRHNATLFEGDKEIFRRLAAGGKAEKRLAQGATFDSHGLRWRVDVWPAPELVAEALARPGAWLPVTGLLLALLVAAAIYMVQERLAQLAWRNQTLQVEIMGRERAERVLRLGNRIAEIFLTGPDEVVYAEVVTLLLEEHRREVSEQARQYLTRIREGAHRMGVLVDDLLNLARVGRTE